jgi:tRNA-dependent cyclodipeptide synthase
MSLDDTRNENLFENLIESPLTYSRYRVKVESCYPSNSRDILSEHGGGFLGISLENKSFSEGKLIEMVRWIGRRTDRYAILIGDCIHRKTLQIRLGLSEEEALFVALELGREFRETTLSLLANSGVSCVPEIFMCSEIRDQRSFERYHAILEERFQNCNLFGEVVRGFSELYIEKRGQFGDDNARKRHVKLSCEYFLEELAIFSCLKDLGYTIMVYPGSFTTLQAIVEKGDYRLKEISPDGLISLNLKAR